MNEESIQEYFEHIEGHLERMGKRLDKIEELLFGDDSIVVKKETVNAQVVTGDDQVIKINEPPTKKSGVHDL